MEYSEQDNYIDLGLALYTRHVTGVPLSEQGESLLESIQRDENLRDEFLETLSCLEAPSEDITFAPNELEIIVEESLKRIPVLR